jgi:hypothetical protein
MALKLDNTWLRDARNSVTTSFKLKEDAVKLIHEVVKLPSIEVVAVSCWNRVTRCDWCKERLEKDRLAQV